MPFGTDFYYEHDESLGDGERDGYDLDTTGADPFECGADRDECVSEDCEVGRRWGAGADYWVR